MEFRGSNRKRCEPVGYCIYCGSTEGDLTTEHVLPAGLGGRIELPKASCTECQKATTTVEHVTLRRMFGPARIRLGYKSRKPKQRPPTLPLNVIEPDRRIRVEEVPIAEYPASLFLVHFPGPTRVAHLYPNNPTEAHAWQWNSVDPAAYMAAKGINGYTSSQFDPLMWARLLAKIAHGYIISELGDVFAKGIHKPLLPDLIRGKSRDFQHIVGGAGRPHNAAPFSFWPTIKGVSDEDTEYLIVYLWLFAELGAPRYMIVAGERPTTPDA